MADDEGPVTLAELRRHGQAVHGGHAERIAELEDWAHELEEKLEDAVARLGRRTDDVRTLATVIRQLAAHVDFPLAEVSDGNSVPAPVLESEPD